MAVTCKPHDMNLIGMSELSIKHQEITPSIPDPFPPGGWGLETRLAYNIMQHFLECPN